MNHYGVILRKLRELKRLPIKEAAKRIERGVGWLSEIENGKGAARIHPQEFERIVAAYDGESYRKQFGIWVAQANKPAAAPKEVQFTGPVLRYLREKAKLSLRAAARQVGLSVCYLSYLETGVKPLSSDLRDRLMRVYGYSPASFKNFTTEDKRSKNIPTRYKLGVLLRHLGEAEIEKVFVFALEQSQGLANP
jgi:transcriptional regulator with XRE-family HTH domain